MGQSTGRERTRGSLRRKPPSRLRYEWSHPTVSCRVSRELYDRLQAIKQVESRSFTDILRAGLGLLGAKAREEAEVRRAGYQEGYAEAQNKYRVTYPCSVCRELLEVAHEEARKAAGKYMQEHGWGHAACHEKRK